MTAIGAHLPARAGLRGVGPATPIDTHLPRHAGHPGLGWHPRNAGSYVGRLTIICLFSYKTFSFSTYVGWVDIIASLLNAVLGSVFLLWIVSAAPLPRSLLPRVLALAARVLLALTVQMCHKLLLGWALLGPASRC